MTETFIREITEKDYDEVIKIRKPEDVYKGMDYLPDYFLMLMRTPGYKGYGVAVNGNLVGVMLIGIIDGGMTAVARAARVSKEYEGKRIHSRLDAYVVSKYKAMPGILWVTVTFNNESYERRIRKMVESKIYEFLLKRVIHTYSANIDDAKQCTRGTLTPPHVKVLNHGDFTDLFDCEDTCRQLFPEERIVVDKVPYRLMKENIPYILTERCTAVGSNIGRDMHVKSDHILLTCGNFAVCTGGLLYNLDIYGQNMKDLKHHIVHHLRNIQHIQNMEIHLEVICDENINKEDIGIILRTYGFQEVSFFRTHMYCIQIRYKDDPSLYVRKLNKMAKL